MSHMNFLVYNKKICTTPSILYSRMFASNKVEMARNVAK